MKLGYVILYVPDVAASLHFFEQAFGFSRRFLHESGTYGGLHSSETTLAFAAHARALPGDRWSPTCGYPMVA